MTLRAGCHALLALACAGVSAPAAAGTAPYDKDLAHGYLGAGVVAQSGTSPLLGDVDFSGGGLLFRGAGHSGKVNPSLDIGFTGQLAVMSRDFDGALNEQAADVLVEVDGGVRLSDLFYVTLGYISHATAYDTANLATTYSVVPLSVGLLKTGESGYLLLQLRAGGGRLGNDQNNDTERVKYGGLRAVVQHGFGSGVQFMLGLGLDRYELDATGDAEEFVRFELGLGFGL